jgi:hypothetical protein
LRNALTTCSSAMPALSRNNEDQDSKRQSLRRELGRGGGCYMTSLLPIDFSDTGGGCGRHPEMSPGGRRVPCRLRRHHSHRAARPYVLDNLLDHAQSLERSRRMGPGTVLEARSYPELSDTVNSSHVVSCAEGTVGRDARLPPGPEAQTTSRFRSRAPVIARGWFGGDDYIRHLVPPDFFHIAIPYVILPHLGATIGTPQLTRVPGGYLLILLD